VIIQVLVWVFSAQSSNEVILSYAALKVSIPTTNMCRHEHSRLHKSTLTLQIPYN